MAVVRLVTDLHLVLKLTMSGAKPPFCPVCAVTIMPLPIPSFDFHINLSKCKKILSMPSFGREVKLFAPCHRFTACKRSLNGVKSVISAKLPDHSRPQFHLSLRGALALMGTWRHLAAKVGTSKGRGKQWQTTPRTCLECSVPEPYWALVLAKTSPRAEYYYYYCQSVNTLKQRFEVIVELLLGFRYLRK
jgi:hypothetical protein